MLGASLKYSQKKDADHGLVGLRGFTIAEVLVALAVVVVVAATAFSTYNPLAESDFDRASAAAAKLNALREAINGFEPTLIPTSFQQNTITVANTNGANPIRISDLTNKISSANLAPNSRNSCNGLYISTEVTAWAVRGPFWSGVVSGDSAVIEAGYVAQDLMIATPADPATFGGGTGGNVTQYLAIRMPSVSLLDAQNLAEVVDGSNTGAGLLRTVKFTPSGTNRIPVDYIVVINGC